MPSDLARLTIAQGGDLVVAVSIGYRSLGLYGHMAHEMCGGKCAPQKDKNMFEILLLLSVFLIRLSLPVSHLTIQQLT